MPGKYQLPWWAGLLLLAAAYGAQAAPIQSHDSIRARARALLIEQLDPAQRADAEIEIGRLDPRLRLRQCTAPLQAFAVGNRSPIGATSVAIRCEGDHPWKLYVTARVVVYSDVLVAARPLNRGEPVQAGDLRRERKDLSRLPYGYLTDPVNATGKVLKRSYLAGQVLQPRQLAAPTLIKRGQQVTLHARAGGIEIRMGGQALSDGSAGDRIRVRNTSSDRVVEGEVVAKGVVKVRI